MSAPMYQIDPLLDDLRSAVLAQLTELERQLGEAVKLVDAFDRYDSWDDNYRGSPHERKVREFLSVHVPRVRGAGRVAGEEGT